MDGESGALKWASTVFPRIEARSSSSTITSDPRPVFKAQPIFKARLVLIHPHYNEWMVTLVFP